MSWKKAASYAISSAINRWREDGNEGDPTIAHFDAWIPYYLSQQWLDKFPEGSIWERK